MGHRHDGRDDVADQICAPRLLGLPRLPPVRAQAYFVLPLVGLRRSLISIRVRSIGVAGTWLYACGAQANDRTAQRPASSLFAIDGAARHMTGCRKGSQNRRHIHGNARNGAREKGFAMACQLQRGTY